MLNIHKLISAIAILVLAGCVSMGSSRFSIERNSFQANYSQIRQIIVEEAASNGFGTLTSEIKPSEFNNWQGQLFFQLKTANGIDQLFAEFRREEGGVSIWVHGAGTRSNPDSAAKAIEARLRGLVAASVTPTRVSDGKEFPKSVEPESKTQPVSTKPENSTVETVRAARMSVVDMQRRLSELGFLKAKPDGILGKNTTAAIKRFQLAAGLPMTGNADNETMSQLSAFKPK